MPVSLAPILDRARSHWMAVPALLFPHRQRLMALRGRPRLLLLAQQLRLPVHTDGAWGGRLRFRPGLRSKHSPAEAEELEIAAAGAEGLALGRSKAAAESGGVSGSEEANCMFSTPTLAASNTASMSSSAMEAEAGSSALAAGSAAGVGFQDSFQACAFQASVDDQPLESEAAESSVFQSCQDELAHSSLRTSS